MHSQWERRDPRVSRGDALEAFRVCESLGARRDAVVVGTVWAVLVAMQALGPRAPWPLWTAAALAAWVLGRRVARIAVRRVRFLGRDVEAWDAGLDVMFAALVAVASRDGATTRPERGISR